MLLLSHRSNEASVLHPAADGPLGCREPLCTDLCEGLLVTFIINNTGVLMASSLPVYHKYSWVFKRLHNLWYHNKLNAEATMRLFSNKPDIKGIGKKYETGYNQVAHQICQDCGFDCRSRHM